MFLNQSYSRNTPDRVATRLEYSDVVCHVQFIGQKRVFFNISIVTNPLPSVEYTEMVFGSS